MLTYVEYAPLSDSATSPKISYYTVNLNKRGKVSKGRKGRKECKRE